ncbi:hypothetical protein [Streptomyces sp. NPDC056464]|uniref:hypothetical protein n=1 Tax=Streptomyces sp. NPDC056464 TaxID=3345828 RepID=UPI0036C9BD5C
MQKRTAALIAASAAAVAVTVTGVTYASADSASSARDAVRPAAAPLGGDHDWDKKGHGHKGDGEIQINERTYSSDPGVCVAVVRPAFTSFNIANNTRRTLQFFANDNCDAGAPLATVGPGGSSFGVGGPGVGAPTSSFRVID